MDSVVGDFAFFEYFLPLLLRGDHALDAVDSIMPFLIFGNFFFKKLFLLIKQYVTQGYFYYFIIFFQVG
jgi:hypothetical protein